MTDERRTDGPRIGGGLARVQVGRTVYTTPEERRLLEELTLHNKTLVTLQQHGWLTDFIRNTTSISRILWEVVQRSHRDH